MAQSPSPILDRIRGLHPSVDEYLVHARPWLDRAPLVILGVGVLWLIVVGILWVIAGATIEALELDEVLHLYAAVLGVLLVLAYVIVGAVVWVLVKKIKAELATIPSTPTSS